MKALITVGTTPFPSLVRFFDRPASDFDVAIQCWEENYQARHARCFAFTRNIQELYDWADIIVTHAGAGTVYSLLETEKHLIVVPNLDRADKHQLDLARYVAANDYAFVAERLDSFESPDELLRTGVRFSRAKYVRTPFFKSDLILDLLKH